MMAKPSPASLAPSQIQSSLLSKSTAGATVLIVLQVGSRALTFAVNQVLLRFLTPERLGISTQLEVYSISVLFFAREALRVAIQRQTDSANDENGVRPPGKNGRRNRIGAAKKTQELVNLAYISIFIGILFALGLAWVYLRSLSSNVAVLQTPFFRSALLIYGIATFLELMAEPCFVVAQQKSQFTIRASAESIATVLRCLVTCGSAMWFSSQGLDLGVLPFAFGQAIYGLSLPLVYYWKLGIVVSEDGFSLMLRQIPSNNGEIILRYFSRSLLGLSTSLFIQGVVKHLLTQGDVILISYLASLQAQGIYALASNYGGLVARMIFQPIEESSRSYFGKILSSIDGTPSANVTKSASKDLHSLLRFYLLLSLAAASVGPTIAPLLLEIVAGSKWASSGAGDVLAKYCYYIPLLAVNGVTEAFISAVATQSELHTQSVWMLAFSLVFAAAGYIFLQIFELGAEGLVWANIISMVLRILWSSGFINKYLRRNGSKLSIMSVSPQPISITLSMVTGAVLSQIQTRFTGGFGDLVGSILIAFTFVILLAACERQYLMKCYHAVKARKF